MAQSTSAKNSDVNGNSQRDIDNIQDLLRLKRDGNVLTCKQINHIVRAIASGCLEDAQLGAFLMSVFIRGMNKMETAALTEAMKSSGFCFSWPPSWTIGDKHSTGGVGDKVSLALAPALATHGLKVPMISGRGLGCTGGTLDKLESIPGYRVYLSEDEMKMALETVGCCIVGQTETLVPADRRMYAVRDVTSTVDSTPLIVSSILSKKASESLHGLVLDVKFGSGSFQPSLEAAEHLATSLVEAAEQLRLPCTALISEMSTPLGRTVGNSLEVEEAVECLRGGGPPDLRELVVKLGGELLSCTGLTDSCGQGETMIERCLDDGSALQKFSHMIQFQGVSPDIAETLCYKPNVLDCLPRSQFTTELKSKRAGYVWGIDALGVAKFCQKLGTSRQTTADTIKYGVGVKLLKVVGDKVRDDEAWVRIYHDCALSEGLLDSLTSAILIHDHKPEQSASKIIKKISSANKASISNIII